MRAHRVLHTSLNISACSEGLVKVIAPRILYFIRVCAFVCAKIVSGKPVRKSSVVIRIDKYVRILYSCGFYAKTKHFTHTNAVKVLFTARQYFIFFSHSDTIYKCKILWYIPCRVRLSQSTEQPYVNVCVKKIRRSFVCIWLRYAHVYHRIFNIIVQRLTTYHNSP